MGPSVAMMSAGMTAASTASSISNAAMAVSAISQVAGGVSSMMSASREAQYTEEQAKIAMQEGQLAAEQKAREVTSFQSSQAAIYAKSGFTLEGSPAIVLESTRRKGQEEVDAILKRAGAYSSLLKMRASQIRNAGRAAFLNGIAGAGASTLKSQILGQKLSLNTPSNVPGVPQNPAMAMPGNTYQANYGAP